MVSLQTHNIAFCCCLLLLFLSAGKQPCHLFSSTKAVRAALFKTGQGPINGWDPVVTGRCRFSPSSTLKRKAHLLPSWCLHYYLAVPPGSDWIRPRSPGASSQPACSLDSLPIMADTQRTDYFTHGHTMAHNGRRATPQYPSPAAS